MSSSQRLSRICERLENNDNSVKKVDLIGAQIGDHGANMLAASLQKNKNTTVKSLVLWYNNIGPVGSKMLVDSLALKYCTVQRLDLAYNHIGDAGAEAIGSFLRNNQTLTRLNLRQNKITKLGAKNIAENLEQNSCLKSLVMHGNQIEPEGLKAFAKLLKSPHCCTSLRELDLGGYLCTQKEGRKAAVQALEQNFVLEQFNLTCGARQKEKINFYLRLNQAGRKLLRDDGSGSAKPVTLWTFVLSRVSHDPSLIYYFIHAKPELFI